MRQAFIFDAIPTPIGCYAGALAMIRADQLATTLRHRLGISGAHLVLTGTPQLQRSRGQFALKTMWTGVDQDIAIALKRA